MIEGKFFHSEQTRTLCGLYAIIIDSIYINNAKFGVKFDLAQTGSCVTTM